MDGNTSTPRGSRGRKRVGSTSRRVWTFAEECELMHALKDLVVKGNKCDNGFRSCYLLLLENSMVDPFTKSMRKKAFPFYAQWVDVVGNDRATGQDSQLYADAINETGHSGVNQNHSFMDLDEEDESSPATEKNASECPSFSVDGTSTAAQANKKGVKQKQSDGG
ncbi:hypothetical protein ACS0TY_005673 [Phlomoides rotata]